MATFYNTATLNYAGNTVRSNTVVGSILEALEGDKIALSQTYRAGDEISYLITVRNTGINDMTGVVIDDNLGEDRYGTEVHIPMAVKEGTVNLLVNGEPVTPAIDTEGGLTVSEFTIPVGGNATLAYTAILNEYAPLASGGTITNTAAVDADGLAAPIELEETITAASGAVLTVEKGLYPTEILEDGALTYTFTIRNYGNTATQASDNVTLSDTFDPRVTISSVTYNGINWTEGVHYDYDDGVFTTKANQIVVPAATFTRDTDDTVLVNPGKVTIVINGTV